MRTIGYLIYIFSTYLRTIRKVAKEITNDEKLSRGTL